MKILIIGFRCLGKTTLGKELSKKYSVVDLDQEIISKAGKSIVEMTKNGLEWLEFRTLETELLEGFLNNSEIQIIIAGGGTGVNSFQNFGQRQSEIIQNSKNCKVVLLNTPIEILSERLLKDYQNPNSHRPILHTPKNQHEINNPQVFENDQDRLKTDLEVYQSRLPKYKELANYIITTTDLKEQIQKIETILCQI